MIAGRGRSGQTIALAAVAALGWQLLGAQAECKFRFEGYLNISEAPTWVVPSAEAFSSGSYVLNPWNPIVSLANTTEDHWIPVNCTSDGWRYVSATGAYMTELTYPDSNSIESNTEVSCDGLFNTTGEGDLLVSEIPASKAVAVSDSLFGNTIELDLTCNQTSAIVDEESCVQFMVNFTNTSPLPDVATALYRFTDPAVPAFMLPPSGNSSPGDIQLNFDNPIVQLDGTNVTNSCNGDHAEYLGEDGEWYHWYTGSDGQMYNLTHVFYATEQDHLNIATIQENWSPNMEAALYNRTVRLLTYCNNEDEREYGYLHFIVGDANDTTTYSCEELPCLCGEDTEDGCASGAFRRYAFGGVGATVAAMGALSALAQQWFLPTL